MDTAALPLVYHPQQRRIIDSQIHLFVAQCFLELHILSSFQVSILFALGPPEFSAIDNQVLCLPSHLYLPSHCWAYSVHDELTSQIIAASLKR
jgi:hypothetical protein